MPSVTPVTVNTDVLHDRRLSVSVHDELFEEREDRIRLDRSLQQSWDQARARFEKETGEDLGDYKSTKHGILGTLKQQYGSDSKEAKKRDDIYATIEMVLNGVELVAATAVQVASMVFAPAQMCFNALDVLISIPRAIKKHAEDLQSLFKEISSYLNNFTIYNRMDRRGALDTALLTSNNEILITLVDLCMLAWKVIKHPSRTILSNVFLKNDAIESTLNSFRDLIDKQNQLTSTITLETVLKNETLSRQIKQRTGRIEETTTETNVVVRGLAAENAENKNMKVDRDRILKIDDHLKLNEALVGGPLAELKSARALLLDETMALFNRTSEFQDWRESSSRMKILYLSGETSSGKTNLLGALAQQIEGDREKLHAQQREEPKSTRIKDDRSIYLTYYSFGLAGKAKDRSKFDTPVHVALKVMAAQLARQSTRYARKLSEEVENVQKGQKSLQQLWQALQLSTFRAPDNSILYMFFDGLDQLKSSLPELGKIMKSSAPRKDPRNEHESLKFRIVLTGKSSMSHRLDVEKLSVIDIADINQPLIRTYVDQRLQDLNIFQDDDEDSKERRDRILDLIPDTSKGSFGIAAQKVKMIEEAVEEDADFETLVDNLQLATLSTLADDGRKTLDRLSRSRDLSLQHKEQLRELLIWAVHARRRPELDELEAALFLQRDRKSLEPLKRKIEGRFEEALELIDHTVYPRDAIEEAINLPDDTITPDLEESSTRRITVNISVEHADDRALRQLISDLGNKIADVDFNLSSGSGNLNETTGLNFSQSDAEHTMIARLLRALSDDRVRRQAAPLVRYATQFLPAHLNAFHLHAMDRIPSDDLKSIGVALINFLWDAESIASAWDVNAFDGSEWMNEDYVRAMEAVLREDRLLNHLDPVQRRWVGKKTGEPSGKANFLGLMANVAAAKWLTDRSQKVKALDCMSFIDSYLDLVHSSATSDDLTDDQWLAIGDPVPGRHTGQSSPAAVLPGHGMNGTHGDETKADGVVDETRTTSSEAPGEGVVSGATNINASEMPSINGHEPTATVEQDEPLLGNFSESSTEIELVGVSTLVARCWNRNGELIPASINLNDCLTNHRGRLRWKLDGNAFVNVQHARLSEGDNVLRVILLDRRGNRMRQSIRLDEQIENQNGKLVFLDSALHRPTEDSADTGDDAGESETSLTFTERVERAKDWAVAALKLDLDGLALVRIGNTLLEDDADGAIQYFNQAESGPQEPWKAIGLSNAYASKEAFGDAVESIRGALSIFRTQHNQRERGISIGTEDAEVDVRDEVRDLFTCLNRASQYEMKLEHSSAAIDLLEEAIACRPRASDCRWRLIRLLCENDRHARAEELFTEWEESFTNLKAQSPAAFVREKMDDTLFYTEVYPVVNASKGTEVYKKIVKATEDAIEEAEAQQHETDSVTLLLNHGLVLACDGSRESLQAACQSWTEAQTIGRDLAHAAREAIRWSSVLAAMYHFDRAKGQLDSIPDTAGPAVVTILDRLRDEIAKVVGPFFEDQRQYDRPTMYIAALAQLAGQRDYAKSMLKADMTSAIEILTDDDAFNDGTGLFLLFQALLHSGDPDGALTVWSLLDRIYTRIRARHHVSPETAEKETLSAVDAVDSNDQTNQSDHDSDAQSSTDSDPDAEQHSSTSQDETSPKESFDDGPDWYKNVLVVCDFCGRDLDSREEGLEQWWCRYCPDVTFCAPCKDALWQGKRVKYVCGPTHDLVLVKHADYTPEEVEGNKVRIEWKWENVQVDGPDGEKVTKRERTGGRIVELSEWIEILKVEWGVEPTKLEGKVQL